MMSSLANSSLTIDLFDKESQLTFDFTADLPKDGTTFTLGSVPVTTDIGSLLKVTWPEVIENLKRGIAAKYLRVWRNKRELESLITKQTAFPPCTTWLTNCSRVILKIAEEQHCSVRESQAQTLSWVTYDILQTHGLNTISLGQLRSIVEMLVTTFEEQET
jgi:hypothetical protein